MPFEPRPLATDIATAIALAREALYARSEEGFEPEAHLAHIEQELRSGKSQGRLWFDGGAPVGLVLWDEVGPLGLSVRLLYLAPGTSSVGAYRELLLAVGREAAPTAFLPSGLSGLSSEVERELFRSLGYAPYSRSDMAYPIARPPPELAPPAGARVRPFRPEDAEEVARVHAAAYEGTFDRYLFLEDLDPLRDAAGMVRDLCQGRWGPFLPDASMVVELDREVVAETLTVRNRNEALIADVAVAPSQGGRGFGRLALSGTLQALRGSGEAEVRLVVTEGNRRAIRLYERVGFVRRFGPIEEWYNPARVPVSPEEP